MKPIDFPQSTKELQRPACMTDDECGSLHVWTDGNQCVSCWKPSLKERFKILFGHPVWMGVMSGRTQPPVYLEAGENVFEPHVETKSKIVTWWRILCDDFRVMWNNVTEGFKQADKRKHFVCGFLIAFLIGIINPWFGFAIGCIAGAIKEWRDSCGYGSVELNDFVFTCMGSACSLLTTFWIHGLIFG